MTTTQKESGDQKLCRICVTGGPSSGKASVLTEIKKAMDSEKVMTIIVPEVITLLNNSSLTQSLFDNFDKKNE